MQYQVNKPGVSGLAYLWLEVRVEQHISIGVNGKVVAIWSKLQEKGNRAEEVCKTDGGGTCTVYTGWVLDAFIYVACAPTVKRGVSLLISSRETSIAITPKMSWF